MSGNIGTDFLTFATGSGANIEDQPSYNSDPQRASGNLPGIARSNFNNKAIRQGTFVACAISTFVYEELNIYVPDDGDVQKYVDYFKQALNALFYGLLPPNPDLSLYVRKAGDTMTGDLQFIPGASIQLANNTWLRAKNASGTPQGVLLRDTSGNIQISDGSSAYTIFNNTPSTVNSRFWSCADTSGAPHQILGIIGDNNTYLNAYNNLFLNASTIWTNCNLCIPNNNYYYGKNSGGAPIILLGTRNDNVTLIAPGAPSDTWIYAASGHTVYVSGNAFTIATTAAYANGTFQCNGALDAYGQMTCHAALNVYGGTNLYAHLNVNNSVGATISGELDCNTLHVLSANATIDGALVVYGGITSVANIAAQQSVYINGAAYIGTRGYYINDSGNPQGQLYTNGGFYVNGQFNCASAGIISGALQVNGNSTFYGGGFQVTGAATFNGANFNAAVGMGSTLGVSGNITCSSSIFAQAAGQGGYFYGITCNDYGVTTSGNVRVTPHGNGANSGVSFEQSTGRPYFLGGANDWLYVWEGVMSGSPPEVQPTTPWFAIFSGGIEVVNGQAYKPGGGMWADSSERRFKEDIEDYQSGLDIVTKLRPRSYKFNGEGGTHKSDTRYIGLIADEVEDIMPELLGEWERAIGGEEKETVKTVDATAIIYALVNSVRELSERLQVLEGR